MEFRVLGPLEVRDGSQALGLGGGKQRVLLAVLLVHAGEVVSAERLIDALWGERPPASALNSVHVYVSQLRRILGDGRLVTRARGYALELEPGQLDLDRFERLVAQGREQLGHRKPERAAETLREALELWRGPPLADFAYEPFAQAEIARLEELRVAALEDRIEADLRSGRHAALVPELEALVREYPLRERLRAQLMLVLYRSGRQADALEAYQDARRKLVDELGLEPGRTLQELERAILRQEPELEPPPPVAAARIVRRRGGTAIALGGAILLAAAIAAAMVGLGRSGNDANIVSVAPNSIAVIDPATNRIVGSIPVGDGPTSVAAGDEDVWVLNRDAQTISLIDVRTRALVKTFAIGATPSDLAFGMARVWVGDSVRSAVVELDRKSGAVLRTIDAPPLTPPPRRPSRPSGGEVAAGLCAVWFASGNATLSRIDPRTGRVVARIRHHGFAGGDRPSVAIGEGAVWVSAYRGVVTRIDPRSNAVAARIVAGDGPIAAGLGSVWVADELLWQIDPSSVLRGNAPVKTIRVGRHPQAIAVGAGSVWVASGDGTLSRIDPRAGKVVRTIHVGGSLAGVAIGGGVVWVAVN